MKNSSDIEYWILFFKSCSHCFPVNPLHPNISMHILHTVLYTSPKVLTRRICLRIKSFFLVIIPFILITLMCDSGVIL